MECRAAGSLLSALDVGAAAPPRGLTARCAVFLLDYFVPRDVKSLFEEVLARTQEASLSSPSSLSRSARGASRPALPKHSPTRRQRRKSAGFRGSDRDHVDYVCPPRRECAATTDSACRLGVCNPVCLCCVCARGREGTWSRLPTHRCPISHDCGSVVTAAPDHPWGRPVRTWVFGAWTRSSPARTATILPSKVESGCNSLIGSLSRERLGDEC